MDRHLLIMAQNCTSNYNFWYTTGCAVNCTSCGLSRNMYNICIACISGYEIDLLFTDGTGNCV